MSKAAVIRLENKRLQRKVDKLKQDILELKKESLELEELKEELEIRIENYGRKQDKVAEDVLVIKAMRGNKQ